MTQIFEYTIFSDSDQEIEGLEKAFETLEATRLNREGWPTSLRRQRHNALGRDNSPEESNQTNTRRN